jgi:hypothetical protein
MATATAMAVRLVKRSISILHAIVCIMIHEIRLLMPRAQRRTVL